ncbi:MAG: VRR-NUC domain-containing protein [Firmicutes bacterium]|nr:VRR-NUC domain-containing protein [Bacillota bacterium]
MSEQKLERRFKREIERRGWRAFKFTSPGMAGMPDRIILIPGNRTFFAELKAPGKKLRELQRKRINMLIAMGYPVYFIDSIDAIDLCVGHIEEVVSK